MPQPPFSSLLAGPRASGRRRVARHLLLWMLFVGFQIFIYQLQPTLPAIQVTFLLINTTAAVGGFYFFSNVVLPRFLVRRRWLLSGLSLLGIYYFWALLSHLAYAALVNLRMPLGEWADYMHRTLDQGAWRGVFSWYGVSMGLNDFILLPFQPILLRFIQFLLVSSNRSLRLERENLNLEVSFLKAQVNPHFLFNTLNNIYTMVVKQDNRAPDMVAHLSHLMHYTVYESDAALVPLDKEIGFLEAYLELERLRYGQKVSINYQNTVAAATGYSITPLLFFPFVENAFKHGVDSSLDASWVQISLTTQDGHLLFEVENSFSQNAPQREVGGVGIVNVERRLALHYAPHDYQLTITHYPDTLSYRVALSLRLTPTKMPPSAVLDKQSVHISL